MVKRPTKAATRRRRKTRKRVRAAAGHRPAAASSVKQARPRPRKSQSGKSAKQASVPKAKRAKPAPPQSRRKRRVAVRGLLRGVGSIRKRRESPGVGRPRKSSPGKRTRSASVVEKALGSALASVGRTVQRAARMVRRGLPAQSVERPKASRGRAPSRRPGSTEARRAPRVSRRVAVPGVAIRAPVGRRYADVLNADALAFLATLHRRFDADRRALPVAQQERREAGGQWGRRVEAVRVADRKTLLRALNSRVGIVVADFAGATWANALEGQVNLKERWAGTLGFTDPETGRDDQLGPNPSDLMVRPRDWSVTEEHLVVDDRPVAAALFDTGLYLFHNARAALAQGEGPCFCLPPVATQAEARLWSEAFAFTETTLGLAVASIKAAVSPEIAGDILQELGARAVQLDTGR